MSGHNSCGADNAAKTPPESNIIRKLRPALHTLNFRASSNRLRFIRNEKAVWSCSNTSHDIPKIAAKTLILAVKMLTKFPISPNVSSLILKLPANSVHVGYKTGDQLITKSINARLLHMNYEINIVDKK